MLWSDLWYLLLNYRSRHCMGSILLAGVDREDKMTIDVYVNGTWNISIMLRQKSLTYIGTRIGQ